MPEMMQLDEIRGAPPNEAELSNQFRAMSMEQRGDASKTWAAWAPGLKLARATAINNNIQVLEKRGPDMLHQYHLELIKGREQPIDQISVQSLKPDPLRPLEQQDDVEMGNTQRSRSEQPPHQATLNALGALEQWRRHFLNDHMLPLPRA